MNKKYSLYELLRGKIVLEENVKYSMIMYSVMCIHVVLVFLFAWIKVTPMVIFNVISVLWYIYTGKLVKDGKAEQFFLGTYLEVFIHTVAAILAIGWQFGFALYTIALIPVSFYVAFSMKTIKKQIGMPIVMGGINFFVFVLCRLFSWSWGSFYVIEETYKIQVIYIFNVTVTFAMLFIFSVLFTMEVRSAQRSLKEKNEALHRLVNYDPLTNLLNRRSMGRHLDAAMEHAREKNGFCVMIGDVDDFKHINDTYGHDCGDEALVLIAKALKKGVSDQGVVCRWGGEEFLVLAGLSLTEGRQLAEQMRQNVEGIQLQYHGEQVPLTITIGVANYQEEKRVEDIIIKADNKLYEGKSSGKNCVKS